MILLDTVVVSELRKRQPSPALLNWLAGVRDDDLFLSVVSIGEIERGIEKKRQAEPAFADALTRWLDAPLRRQSIARHASRNASMGGVIRPVGA